MVALCEGIFALKSSREKLIRAFKVTRGEGAQKYSKSKKAEIAGYAKDSEIMEAEQVKWAKDNPSSISIIGTIYAGLAPSLVNDDYMMKQYFKNEDLLVIELIEKLEKSLMSKMEAYLKANNANEYLEHGKIK